MSKFSDFFMFSQNINTVLKVLTFRQGFLKFLDYFQNVDIFVLKFPKIFQHLIKVFSKFQNNFLNLNIFFKVSKVLLPCFAFWNIFIIFLEFFEFFWNLAAISKFWHFEFRFSKIFQRFLQVFSKLSIFSSFSTILRLFLIFEELLKFFWNIETV